MPKIKFSMEEIREVMEKHAQSKFKLTGNEDSFFNAEVNEGGQTENVEFVIDCAEQQDN